MFENRVLRRIFGPKRDEVAGGWRNLLNGFLHSFHPSPDIFRVIKSRRMRWTGHISRMGEMRNACKILVGKPEGKRIRTPRSRCEDYDIIYLREIGFWGVELDLFGSE
jgi:hypothetical protein